MVNGIAADLRSNPGRVFQVKNRGDIFGRGNWPEGLRTAMEEVFRGSVNLDKVRIHWMPAGWRNEFNGKAETSAGLITSDIYVAVDAGNHDFVHELVHVWQRQHPDKGGQKVHGRWAYRMDIILNEILSGKSFRELNSEQQATVIERAYGMSYFGDGPNNNRNWGRGPEGNAAIDRFFREAVHEVRGGFTDWLADTFGM